MFSILKTQVRFASKKTGGSSRNGRDSKPKFLGLKVGNGETVKNGSILVKQRGTKWHPGSNVIISRDHSIHSTITGTAMFHYDIRKQKRLVSVNDGTLSRQICPSRDDMKKLLADRVDAQKYLGLRGVKKYQYIRSLMNTLGKEKEIERLDDLKRKAAVQGSRKFSLTDLTMIS